jgi:hypothetical protein
LAERLESNETECFYTRRDSLMENELKLDYSVKAKITEYLRELGTAFRELFPAMSNDKNWKINHLDDMLLLHRTHCVLKKKNN